MMFIRFYVWAIFGFRKHLLHYFRLSRICCNSTISTHLFFMNLPSSKFLLAVFCALVWEELTQQFLFLQVTLVVNYDLPVKNTTHRNMYAEPDFETYLHRIGRSGRFGRKGRVLHTWLVKQHYLAYIHSPYSGIILSIGSLRMPGWHVISWVTF